MEAESLCHQVQQAAATKTPLRIQGGNNKAFYGRAVSSNSQILEVSGYRGIINYEPTELVITARAGTPLTEIEATLAEHQQRLPFEPPHFGPNATLGGTISCGFSGPSRPYAGAARDYVLGIKMINGRGELLNFGGQVMKNVAGYDVPRLLTGALGTLGVILDVSLKVLPKPAYEQTLVQRCSEREALAKLAEWGGKPYPISAAAYCDDVLFIRLAGAVSAVAAAVEQVGGDAIADSASFWCSVREHSHPFFASQTPLWRLSVPATTGALQLPGAGFVDWGGAQRWLLTDLNPDAVFAAAAAVGGHATLFRGGERSAAVFQPLQPALMAIHQRLKHSFDPEGIFNPGRQYAEF